MNIYNKLVKLANDLDQKGLYEEADQIDGILRSYAGHDSVPQETYLHLGEIVANMSKAKDFVEEIGSHLEGLKRLLSDEDQFPGTTHRDLSSFVEHMDQVIDEISNASGAWEKMKNYTSWANDLLDRLDEHSRDYHEDLEDLEDDNQDFLARSNGRVGQSPTDNQNSGSFNFGPNFYSNYSNLEGVSEPTTTPGAV